MLVTVEQGLTDRRTSQTQSIEKDTGARYRHKTGDNLVCVFQKPRVACTGLGTVLTPPTRSEGSASCEKPLAPGAHQSNSTCGVAFAIKELYILSLGLLASLAHHLQSSSYISH